MEIEENSEEELSAKKNLYKQDADVLQKDISNIKSQTADLKEELNTLNKDRSSAAEGLSGDLFNRYERFFKKKHS